MISFMISYVLQLRDRHWEVGQSLGETIVSKQSSSMRGGMKSQCRAYCFPCLIDRHDKKALGSYLSLSYAAYSSPPCYTFLLSNLCL
jgi:hypothetical protein